MNETIDKPDLEFHIIDQSCSRLFIGNYTVCIQISNVDKLYETNELQFAFRLHYHFFMVSIHMQTSSAAKYALYMHLNSQKHLADDVRHCIIQ